MILIFKKNNVYKLNVLASHKWIFFCYIQQELKIVCNNIYQIKKNYHYDFHNGPL